MAASEFSRKALRFGLPCVLCCKKRRELKRFSKSLSSRTVGCRFHMRTLDWIVLLGFAGYAVASGLRNRVQASRDLEEYFLAGRTLPGWKAGLSMAATQFAADTPLLVTGIVAVSGIFALWQLWIYALAFLMMGFVLAGSWRRAGVITDAELTELRYGKRPAAVLRLVKAFYFGTIFNCTVLAWVFFAAAKVSEPFLLWHAWLPSAIFEPFLRLVEWIGIPISLLPPDHPDVWVHSASNLISILVILVFTTFYSTTGGLRSVVATDVVQIMFMLGGTLLFSFFAVNRAGGLDAIHQRIVEGFAGGGPTGLTPEQILAFTPGWAKQASFAVLALFGLQWLIQLNADGTGYLAQRSMACRSVRDAKIAALVFTFTQVLLRSLLWLPLALALLVLYPPDPALPRALLQAEREGTYVRGMADLLPVGVMGLMLTGMFAAFASTVDTHINWGSSYWTNDIYKRFVCRGLLHREPNPRTLVWVARGSNLLVITIALVVMTQLRSINHAWQTSLLLGAGMGVVLVLRWIWWRMNAWGEIAAILASAILAPILLATVDDGATRLLVIGVVSTAAALVAVRWRGPEDLRQLTEFYDRAHPPGFWGPVAARRGERAATGSGRLRRSVAATFLAGLSCFCLLVGLGSWLCRSPAPVWFPWSTVWQVGLIVVGLGLCPLWWRLVFPSETRKNGKR